MCDPGRVIHEFLICQYLGLNKVLFTRADRSIRGFVHKRKVRCLKYFLRRWLTFYKLNKLIHLLYPFLIFQLLFQIVFGFFQYLVKSMPDLLNERFLIYFICSPKANGPIVLKCSYLYYFLVLVFRVFRSNSLLSVTGFSERQLIKVVDAAMLMF